MERDHLLGLSKEQLQYLLEIKKLEFEERERERKRAEREVERAHEQERQERQERMRVSEVKHMEVMANIELKIAELRNGRTYFSGKIVQLFLRTAVA